MTNKKRAEFAELIHNIEEDLIDNGLTMAEIAEKYHMNPVTVRMLLVDFTND